VRKIKEILRLAAEGLSNRAIGKSVGIGHTTVAEYRRRAVAAAVSWELCRTWTDQELEARLFPLPAPSSVPRPQPDWAAVHRELRRKGVTLQLLWLEYKEAHAEGYQYSQFCEHYRRWCGTLKLVMRQVHRAGEKVFVDYAGLTVPVTDRETGAVREAQVFVGVLGASNYSYAEATWTQDLSDWIGAHVRMYEYFDGVPAVTVPDNLKSGVKHACFYEPDINPTYHELATYYDTVVLPTRTARPRDKAKVEAGVLLVERWILARLRKHTFFTLGELNKEIRRLLDMLNDRPFQKLEGSRRTLFETLDRPALRPLPQVRYEYARWKKARVNVDYHIDVLGHYYSVPHALFRKEVDVRITSAAVEILHGGRRVAAHPRSERRGAHTTDPGHMPRAHRNHLEWSPSRLVRWAQQTGTHTGIVVERILESRRHPEQGYRSCLGLLRLGERYTPARLEAACDRALAIGALSYRSVRSILEKGLDQVPLEEQTALTLPADHANVRGPDYFLAPNNGDGR
jgi:transposase